MNFILLLSIAKLPTRCNKGHSFRTSRRASAFWREREALKVREVGNVQVVLKGCIDMWKRRQSKKSENLASMDGRMALDLLQTREC